MKSRPLPPSPRTGTRGATTLALCTSIACSGLLADDPPPAQPDEKAGPAEEAAPEEEAPTEFRNWVTFGVGGTFIDGSESAFQQRTGLPGGAAFGGIESFHYEEDVGKTGLFKVDGHGIYDNEDYGIRLELSDSQKGFVRAGYSQYRSYYNGTGGYYPNGGVWFPLSDDDLHVDRGELFFEAGLRLEGKPQVTVRYAHQFRDGYKTSTAWGDAPTPDGNRHITAGFWDLDELRDIFEVDARHTVKQTDFGVGVRYERMNNDNARKLTNTGNATPAVTDREQTDADVFTVHAFSETRLNEKNTATVGYSFTTLDTDLGGFRGNGPDFDEPTAPVFTTLAGGSRLYQHVGNINYLALPWKSVAIIPSVRIEDQAIEGASQWNATGGPAATSDRDYLDVSERLEVRFTGVTNLTSYVRGDWAQGDGSLFEQQFNTGTFIRSTDDTRYLQKYTVGANWYALRRLNLGAQYYYKTRDNEYDHPVDSTGNAAGNRYPAYIRTQDFDTHDVNFRVTGRPHSTVTLTGRYDFQLTTFNNQPDGLPDMEAAEVTTHIFSLGIAWTPWHRLYLQAYGSYVTDQTDGKLDSDVIPAPAPAFNIGNVVPDSDSDYWMANATIGFVCDDKTDLQLSYYYYLADNYVSNAPDGMPFGAGLEEHGVSIAATRKLSSRVRASLRYGFFTSEDETSGFNNDYDAHLVHGTVTYAF